MNIQNLNLRANNRILNGGFSFCLRTASSYRRKEFPIKPPLNSFWKFYQRHGTPLFSLTPIPFPLSSGDTTVGCMRCRRSEQKEEPLFQIYLDQRSLKVSTSPLRTMEERHKGAYFSRTERKSNLIKPARKTCL